MKQDTLNLYGLLFLGGKILSFPILFESGQSNSLRGIPFI